MHLPLPAASEDALIAKYHGMLLGYARMIGRRVFFRVQADDLYQYGAIGILLQFRRCGDINIRSAAFGQMMDGLQAEMRKGKFCLTNESTNGLNDLGPARDDIPAIEAAIDIRRLCAIRYAIPLSYAFRRKLRELVGEPALGSGPHGRINQQK
jgi:hypothetical protein